MILLHAFLGGLFLQEVVTNLNMIFILKNMGMAVRISRVSKAKELNNQMRYVILLVIFSHCSLVQMILKFFTLIKEVNQNHPTHNSIF